MPQGHDTVYLRVPDGPLQDHPNILACAGTDEDPKVAYVMEPDVPVPGSDSPGSRIPNADVRLWRETPLVGPVIAEARIDRTRPEVGYVPEAWSEDEQAHRYLIDAIKVCLATSGLDERTELRWITSREEN